MGKKEIAKAPAQTGKTVMVSARVPPELRKRAKQYGLDRGQSVQQIVLEALDEYLKKRGA